MERFGEALGEIPEEGSTPAEALRLAVAPDPAPAIPKVTNPSPKARMSKDRLPKELQMENRRLEELLEVKEALLQAKEQIIQQGQEMLSMKE